MPGPTLSPGEGTTTYSTFFPFAVVKREGGSAVTGPGRASLEPVRCHVFLVASWKSPTNVRRACSAMAGMFTENVELSPAETDGIERRTKARLCVSRRPPPIQAGSRLSTSHHRLSTYRPTSREFITSTSIDQICRSLASKVG